MPAKVNRRVVRESADQLYSKGRYRNVIIELEAGGSLIRVRLAKERQRYSINYATLYKLAVRLEVDAKRWEKEKARRAKRKAVQA